MSNVIEYKNYVGGEFVDSTSGAMIDVINPANGELISRVPKSNRADVDAAVIQAKASQAKWARLPAIERAGYLVKLAEKIRENKDHFAQVIMTEQGKILSQAEAEVRTAADYLDYMAGWARRIEGEILPSDRADETIFFQRKPIGVIGAILPWNFPFFLIVRKLGPALVTGNSIVIKPSEETPNNAFEFARLVDEVGLPDGVFNLISGDGASGKALCDNPHVGMVSFTGSVETGKKIMEVCAKNVTKVNLELGGKAPAIVTENADIDLAVKAIKDSRIINSGQACICTERVYVHREVADIFIEKLVNEMRATTYGDPRKDANIDMGPLVNQTTLRKVDELVNQAKEEGAELLCGGGIADNLKGHHYHPTVLMVQDNAQRIMQKEIFGPVIPVMVVDSLEQALGYANDSDYGLSSSIFSKDADEIMLACRELEFGEVYVNRENIETMQGYHAGRRQSGIGGADGKHGLYEYMETQVVYWQSHR